MGEPASVALPFRPAAHVRGALRLSESARWGGILLLALVQGLLFLFFIPPWQHYDEPTHFEHAWLIANRPGLPEVGDEVPAMRREVMASMVAHDFYQQLPQPAFFSDRRIDIGYTELTHPPVYYLLASMPLRLVRHLDITTQLYAARAASVGLWLITVLCALGLVRDLTAPGHPLRWAFPLALVLLPPLANHMTAVNNDVGAVAAVSLYLWGAVRLVRYGPSLSRLLWVTGAALLAVLSKNTAGLALLVLPLLPVLSLWVRAGWRWRWFWASAAALATLFFLLFFDWADAAYWYRVEQGTLQQSATLAALPDYPERNAIALELTASDPNRQLMSPLLAGDVPPLRENTVTVGGWVWADREVQSNAPGMVVSNRGSTVLIPLTEPITVTTTPTFVSNVFWLAPDVEVAYFSFFARPSPNLTVDPTTLYLYGAFLVPGELSFDTAPDFASENPLPPQVAENNLVRNPYGKQGWPRLRAWVDRMLETYIHRSPGFLMGAVLDVQRNGPFLAGRVAPYLLDDLFVAFGWGHVRFEGAGWSLLFRILFVGALLGWGKWLVQGWGRRPRFLSAALFGMGVLAITVWIGALTWPLPFPWAKLLLPSARYAFPVILPTLLLLVGGWWALPPRRWRHYGLLALLLVLVLLNVVGWITIRGYYGA